MPTFAANLTMMFNEVAFPDRYKAAAQAGFSAVECLFPYSIPAHRLSDMLKSLDLTQAMFNLAPGDWDAGERGIASLPDRFEDVKASVELGLDYAEATGAKRLHLMAGLADRSDPEAAAAYRRSVEYVAGRLAERNLVLLLEPINPRSMPGYFLNDFMFTEQLIADIGLPNIRIQYDIFHRQIMHGDIARSFQRLLPLIGHVQIASVPSRHEPNGEELNYPYIFEMMDAAGYSGFVGCEYVPATTTIAGLGWFEPFKRRT
ncbi:MULTISPECIES: 2-oxo-tetronate isomerase [unclassified Rhizobium]|uniref:2-oxo-tetronate isomerase n=1 Tax=unclassified Rhizobium TaxID=2613769 RepID=UPI000715E3F4|nr:MULTISPECIES: 2-oxo-tetronate isomerase [unclassified Rhizobium]KQS88159.1 hydroxypyruvate isomerase [Rhizobium sp. Leaf391]KQT00656.1 hydroxypyruvate isomerase [Rhizobium sp. Leaf386]KQU09129.1 hydroxypyruvate isomerase [Rhizobium sp. Leaf453]